jgi:hypothetical protein
VLAGGVPPEDVCGRAAALRQRVAEGGHEGRVGPPASGAERQQRAEHFLRHGQVVGEGSVIDQHLDRARRLARRHDLQGRHRQGGTGAAVDLRDAVLRTAGDLAVLVAQRLAQGAQGGRPPLRQGV